MRAMRSRVGSSISSAEKKILSRIREALQNEGFTLVEKTHGNAFQPGWPDLYCFHPELGHRWVEVKTPIGTLTRAQRVRFARWEKAGESVWVLCDPSETFLLRSPPNWREWI